MEALLFLIQIIAKITFTYWLPLVLLIVIAVAGIIFETVSSKEGK